MKDRHQRLLEESRKVLKLGAQLGGLWANQMCRRVREAGARHWRGLVNLVPRMCRQMPTRISGTSNSLRRLSKKTSGFEQRKS